MSTASPRRPPSSLDGKEDGRCLSSWPLSHLRRGAGVSSKHPGTGLPTQHHPHPLGRVAPGEATAVTQTGCSCTPGAQIKADCPHRIPLVHRGDGPPCSAQGCLWPAGCVRPAHTSGCSESSVSRSDTTGGGAGVLTCSPDVQTTSRPP